MKVYTTPLSINDDQLWTEFVVRIINHAEWDLPEKEPIGMRLMKGLGEESPLLFNLIDINSDVDIWGVDNLEDPKLVDFWRKLFEFFVEHL